jgi:hypothetical protein
MYSTSSQSSEKVEKAESMLFETLSVGAPWRLAADRICL